MQRVAEEGQRAAEAAVQALQQQLANLQVGDQAALQVRADAIWSKLGAEGSLELLTPCCRRAWQRFDDADCYAQKCSSGRNCRAHQFCGLCLRSFGNDEDAPQGAASAACHDHVRTCELNTGSNGLFPSDHVVEAAWCEMRRRQVRSCAGFTADVCVRARLCAHARHARLPPTGGDPCGCML